MRILLASSEVFPFSKTGGLADMVGAFARSLAESAQDVIVVTPLHRGIRDRFPEIQRFEWDLRLSLGTQTVEGGVWRLVAGPRLTFYFVDQPDYFDRPSLYQHAGADYVDNAERFTFFSKAVVNLARYLPQPPDLVHVHDWQAALVLAFIRHERDHAGWGTAPKTCLTIHNLAYQGAFAAPAFGLTNLPRSFFTSDGLEFYGGMNCLKGGIAFADMISTVSPRYAREIMTEALGCGLDGILRQRQAVVVGILNGVDYTEWRTTRNPHLPHAYSASRLAGKLANKAALQKELGLPERTDVPLFGNITRLVEQKGVDIQLAALEEMLAADLQFILLGSGTPVFENAYAKLAKRFPKKVAVKLGYEHALSHRIEAGCDFYLMPSRFEPCGLNQMYSHRYGTIPIVRATGGLDDTVIDLAENADHANGIKFFDYSARALAHAMRKALLIYQNSALLGHLRRNAMEDDFSWSVTTAKYLAAFERFLALK